MKNNTEEEKMDNKATSWLTVIVHMGIVPRMCNDGVMCCGRQQQTFDKRTHMYAMIHPRPYRRQIVTE